MTATRVLSCLKAAGHLLIRQKTYCSIAGIPTHAECGGVLGTVKAMPFGWPQIAASLDRLRAPPSR
jgi:hypothetical protein